MTANHTLLGVSGGVTAEEADQLVQNLSEAWEVVYKRPVRGLDDDLIASRFWFDPVAQGQRLRREISKLVTMPEHLDDPGPPLTLCVEPQKWLVTPEGRCVLDLLKRLPTKQSTYSVTPEQIAPYERRLARLYRDWSRHRLNSVVALLAGTTKPLQIAAAGIVVALLVNRSTSEDRALIRYTTDPERSVVDKAFFASVQVFADILSPSRRRSEMGTQLVSGWMLYEVRRRIGDAMVMKDARGNRNGAVWIQADSEPFVVDIVARDLVRGHRTRVGPEKFAEAFNSLVTELRRESKALAGFGLAHERPRDTARLRQRFTDRLSHYDDASA